MVDVEFVQPTKSCARCAEIKPALPEYFSLCKTGVLGFHSWCKPCCAEVRRLDRKARPQHYAEIENLRHLNHREKRNASCRQWHIAHGGEYYKKRRAENPTAFQKYNETRRIKLQADSNLREIQNRLTKAWREANKAEVNAARREKWKRAAPSKRLRMTIGSAIYHSLRGTKKGGVGWQMLVGYTLRDLMQHLERQFVKGMSWQNYGSGWHVDHIAPVSSFDINDVKDASFVHCWALSNLRPLWAKENLVKHKKCVYLL